MANWAALRSYHCNQYAGLECEHCQGVIRHESWCVSVSPAVIYAYEIVANPNKLTVGDAFMLHALGVALDKNSALNCTNASCTSRSNRDGC